MTTYKFIGAGGLNDAPKVLKEGHHPQIVLTLTDNQKVYVNLDTYRNDERGTLMTGFLSRDFSAKGLTHHQETDCMIMMNERISNVGILIVF